MKRKMRLSLLMLGILLLFAETVRSELPPIALVHTYQGQTSSGEGFVLNFELLVQNPTDSPLYNIVLVTDPIMWLPALKLANLSVGNLAGREVKKVIFSIMTEVLLDEDLLREQPLTWFGEYADAKGTPFDKIIISLPIVKGGAQ